MVHGLFQRSAGCLADMVGHILRIGELDQLAHQLALIVQRLARHVELQADDTLDTTERNLAQAQERVDLAGMHFADFFLVKHGCLLNGRTWTGDPEQVCATQHTG